MSTPDGAGPRDPDDPVAAAHAAAAVALERARAAEADARHRGSPYGIALARTQAGHALLGLGRPDEALAEFGESDRYVDLIRAEGSHEVQRLLRLTSAATPPPDADTGDLVTLQAWTAVGRAMAHAAAGRPDEAAAAVAAARPLTRGWGRRSLRKTLDQVAAGLAPVAATGADSRPRPGTQRGRAAGGPADGSAATLAQRYEAAVSLVEAGRAAEGARAALLLVRDADAAGDARTVALARQTLGAALAAGGMGPQAAGAQATEALRAAFDGFVALGDEDAVIAAAPALAQRLVAEGSPSDAVAVLRGAREAAEARGNLLAHVDLLTASVAALDAAGDPGAALRAAESAVTLAEQLDDRVRVADARHGEAVVRAVHLAGDPGELVEALSLLDAARDGYAAAGFPDRAAGCDHEAAALLARAGSWSAASARYRAARDAYRSLPIEQRDAGSWPDELADCERSLALLAGLESGAVAAPPPEAFDSGGHAMRRGSPGTR